MDRSLRTRTIIFALATIFCALALLPTLVPRGQLPGWYTDYLFRSKIALGTDLAGGARFIYSIDLDKAVDDKASEIKRDLEAKMSEDGIKGSVRTPAMPIGAVTVVVTDPSKRPQIQKLISSDYGDTVVTRTCNPDPNPKDNVPAGDPAGSICIRVSSDFADKTKAAALRNAVNTIRERIDEKGIAEPSVIEKGDDIIVELPGLDDEAIGRIKDIIARTAKLEFKVVDNGPDGKGHPWMRDLFAHVEGDPNQGIPGDPDAAKLGVRGVVDGWNPDSGGHQTDFYLFASDREEAVSIAEAKDIGCWTKDKEKDAGSTKLIRCNVTGRRVIERYLENLAKAQPKFAVPEGKQIGYEYVDQVGDEEGAKPFWKTYFLDRAVRLAGSAISNAVPSYDPQTNRPIVLVDFNRYGGRVFGDLTAQNVGRKFATILDDKVKSAPIVNGAIRGGRCSITMGGNNPKIQEKEAQDLVAVLKTGSLPAPLREESFAKIGATLGSDAISKTRLSFILGVVFVVLIMVGVYRWSGWIAVFAVMFHVLVTLAVMALFGATLTLPGIAALVLSVGMCVDGNVLINERIRDELLLGKSVRGSVDQGFSRAFSAILDGQLTIAASAWVLLQYGTGPIKGFAVMMLVGVFTTITTNTWVTRILFDWKVVRNKNATTISI